MAKHWLMPFFLLLALAASGCTSTGNIVLDGSDVVCGQIVPASEMAIIGTYDNRSYVLGSLFGEEFERFQWLEGYDMFISNGNEPDCRTGDLSAGEDAGYFYCSGMYAHQNASGTAGSYYNVSLVLQKTTEAGYGERHGINLSRISFDVISRSCTPDPNAGNLMLMRY